jgi:hypothetical protein
MNQMALMLTISSLLTQSLGGEGYLTFEGNEFGHPEAGAALPFYYPADFLSEVA